MEYRVELDGVFRNLRFSACHFIPGHEKCSRLHGHDYVVEVQVQGTLGTAGMVIDFALLKRHVEEIISLLDHKVIIPAKNPELEIRDDGITVSVKTMDKFYQFPHGDCILCDIVNSTAENLAEFICQKLVEKLNENKNVVSVACGVSEGAGQKAWCTMKVST